MIERLIRRILKQQIDQVFRDREALVTFLRAQGHTAEADETALVDQLIKQPPEVYQDLARLNQKFPNIAVVLGPESEHDKQPLSDLAGIVSADDAAAIGAPGLEGQPIYAALATPNIHLYVHATHPDVAIVLLELLRSFVLLMHPALQAAGATRLGVAAKGLEPLNLDTVGPDYIFRRVLQLALLVPVTAIPTIADDGTFNSIAGLHVAGGSTSSGGNATTLITTGTG